MARPKWFHHDQRTILSSYSLSDFIISSVGFSPSIFEDGKPKKKDYKRFKIEALTNQDDYESMRQVIRRRFSHFKEGDTGFETEPDLLLIDGGIAHARAAVEALEQLDLQMQVFGMVKDDRHRTRALVTPEGEEIRIDNNQAVFSLIGNIQEETHRFAITYHRQLRSKRLKYSELDTIAGIGPKRKQDLLKYFKSITAISQATLEDLERHLPKDAAASVYKHFHAQEE